MMKHGTAYEAALKTIPTDSATCAERFGEYVNSAYGDVRRTRYDLNVLALYKPIDAALEACTLTGDNLAELEYEAERAGFYAGWRAAMAFIATAVKTV